MKLSIITINYNNASGLQKTMESVLNQTSRDFEYIVVDGGSTDSSCQAIASTSSAQVLASDGETFVNGIRVTCISEPDSGIYNAMNKGIQMAKGEYVQFLNSGDLLAASDVTERMIEELGVLSSESGRESSEVDILYGNMLKPYKGRVVHDKGFAGRKPTMLDFYNGTLNHSPAYIKRTLFDTYGMYDESLQIVSDWKWYLQVIGLNNVMPRYTDIDVTVFDMTGISSVNSELDKAERRKVFEELLPLSVLADYGNHAVEIDEVSRLKRYWLSYKLFWLVERMLFKLEKFKFR